MSLCQKCGNSLTENARFCALCGTATSPLEAATLPLNQPPADPMRTVVDQGAWEPPPADSTGASESPQPTSALPTAPSPIPPVAPPPVETSPLPPRAAPPTVANWQPNAPTPSTFEQQFPPRPTQSWQPAPPPAQQWGGPSQIPTSMPMAQSMPVGARTVPNWAAPAPPPPPSFGASPVANKFIDNHKNAWQRLEELLALLGSTSLRRLHREEVRELGNYYRRTASDLAIARAESRDPRLVNYLNSLVIRAHGKIYTADARGGHRIRNFFLREFPQTFRRTWRFTAVAFLTFMIFFGAGFLGTWRDADFSEFAGVPSSFRSEVLAPKIRWWKELNKANQVGSSRILTNNIGVTFLAFAMGAFLAVGALYIMATNGASIGAVLALTYKAGYGSELLTFMAGHGVIELSCIFIAGGAGMMIGYSMLVPGDLSRADALKTNGLEAVRLIGGVACLLVLAGIIEGFISPAEISPIFKWSIAAITGIALYGYLLLAGRGEEEATDGPPALVIEPT